MVFITTTLEPVTKEPVSMVMTSFYLTHMLYSLVIDRKAIFVCPSASSIILETSIRGYGTSSAATFAHYYSCLSGKVSCMVHCHDISYGVR